MENEEIQAAYTEFQNEHVGFAELLVLNESGEQLFASDTDFATAEESAQIMDVWLNNKPAVEIKEVRYPVLKWDPLQFAARNVNKLGAIIGCKTKLENYVVARLDPSCKTPLIEAGVLLNRWSWNLL
jgi:hypothetical protein